MDIHELQELMLDVECMTVLRHVTQRPQIAALVRLVGDCVSEGVPQEELAQAYCEAYNAWLSAAAHGKGGFARVALELSLIHI